MEIHHLQWSLIFFGLAAVLGLYMFSRVYRGIRRQNSVMLLHGLFAGVALSILLYYSALEVNSEVPYLSIFFFVVAVFGGIFMVTWDKIMNRKMPRYFPPDPRGSGRIRNCILNSVRHQASLNSGKFICLTVLLSFYSLSFPDYLRKAVLISEICPDLEKF